MFQDPEFDPQKILSKSSAASGLCAWVINIHKFYNVYLIVGPKQKALRDAQSELRSAQEKLDYFNGKIQVLSQTFRKKRIFIFVISILVDRASVGHNSSRIRCSNE